MTEERLILLITHHLLGEADQKDAQELADWVSESHENEEFLLRVTDERSLEIQIGLWKNLDPGEGFRRWQRNRQKARVRRITGWAIAAGLLGVVVMVKTIHRQPDLTTIVIAKPAVVPIVEAGRNTATLTLADGRMISLDSVGRGELTKQGSSSIVKRDSGSLAYLNTGPVEAIVRYNVLTTPKAGQFKLTLPDGSQVWLNNVSSIRYPTSFRGTNRTVELSGEAYFEIAKDPTRPFVVKVRDESVEVLGTSFNIMAYPEEGGTQTTLLTGKVSVKSDNESVQLLPDEQALVGDKGSLSIQKNVDADDIVSWKDGFFYFGRASFATVMRQLARWYDVEVVYEGKVPDMEFGGKIDRSLPLNELLKFLDKNQIHFRLEGRKLIVLPN